MPAAKVLLQAKKTEELKTLVDDFCQALHMHDKCSRLISVIDNARAQGDYSMDGMTDEQFCQDMEFCPSHQHQHQQPPPPGEPLQQQWGEPLQQQQQQGFVESSKNRGGERERERERERRRLVSRERQKRWRGQRGPPRPPHSKRDRERDCFPGDAIVQVQGGSYKNISDLRVGENVLATDSTGKLVYSQVWSFGHASPDEYSEFVNLHTEKNKLVVTPAHYIPVCTSSYCSKTTFEYAKSVVVGDFVLCSSKDEVTPCKVNAITRSFEKGFFNPHTMANTIVVNNLLCSSYSGWFLDGYVHVNYLHTTYAMLLSPFKLLATVASYFERLDDANSFFGSNNPTMDGFVEFWGSVYAYATSTIALGAVGLMFVYKR
jgi:hypothetical protein